MARKRQIEHVSITLDFPHNDLDNVAAVLDRIQASETTGLMTKQNILDALAEVDTRLKKIPNECREQAIINFYSPSWKDLKNDEMLTCVEIVRESKMWKLVCVERKQRRYSWYKYNPSVLLPLNSDDALDILNSVLDDLQIEAEY